MRSSTRYRPRSRRRNGLNYKKIGTMITLVVFVFMIFASVRFFSLFNALRGSDNPAIWRPDSRERTQFLVVGTEGEELRALTLISVPKDSELPVALIKIPPQSLTQGDEVGHPLTKVWQAGLNSLTVSINQLLGHSLRIDHTFVYDMAGLHELVGALKSVSFTVDEELRVSQGNKDFVFIPGEQNPLTANNINPLLGHGLDDPQNLASITIQNRILVAVFNSLFVTKNIGNLVDNIRLVRKYHSTDMGLSDLSRFRDTLAALDSGNSVNFFLPGHWFSVGGEQLWNTNFIALGLLIRQVTENIPPYNKADLKVDVFNGNGIQGFATRTATILRSHAFEVGRVDNANQIVQKTKIYYLPEFYMAALELGALLGTDPVYIRGSYPGSTSPVVIILGTDLEGR